MERPLFKFPEAEKFAIDILNIKDEDALEYATKKIVSVELQLQQLHNLQTHTNKDYRVKRYRADFERNNLRKKIHDELISNARLLNEEEIRLGHGGALPSNAVVKYERRMYYVIGLPASGKSGIANLISDNDGAVIIDSDMAKRKIPEYTDMAGGATLVADESSAIIMSDENQNLLQTCVQKGMNIVVPKIGHIKDKIVELAMALKTQHNYTVYLILVKLDRKKSTQRAYKRFIDTGRYVPLSLIFDLYSNEPTISYSEIKNLQGFDGFAHINADVNIGNPYQMVEDVGIDLLKKGLLMDEYGNLNFEMQEE